ncbi:DUF6212 domain-containing protein [Natronohydrobacter thiooxidans]|uniref:DUF6212 domain-containing protein n=1 Tax=Natronohydrobacter thiooxidans TaxID=87172 RepID=UPI000ABEF1A6|nr:DUF6212 domain-containing protein [Natronohydrobacter thiooxidans]
MTARFTILATEADLAGIGGFPGQRSVDFVVTDGSGFMSADMPSALNPLDVAARCLGAVVAHADSQGPVEQALKVLSEASGLDMLPIADVTDMPTAEAGAALAQFIAEQLNAITIRQARRIVDLSSALKSVRSVHEETLSAFKKIEAFVSGNNLCSRTQSLTLAPTASVSLKLRAGQQVVQRLPVSSEGLSDIEIYCAALPKRSSGILTAVLRTLEDDVEHASWIVSAEEISGPTLRFCLPVALSSDIRSPVLELGWDGSTVLPLGYAMAHPDERFQAQLDGMPAVNVLAMRLWTYLPGSMAPLPVDGILPASTNETDLRKCVLDSALLATVVNMTPESAASEYVADRAAIQVHPLPEDISAMCIRRGIPKGAVQVSANIHTASDQAQNIEYALGLLPSSETAKPLTFDQTLPEQSSDWVLLTPDSKGEVHLFMQEPLADVHDLVLMTRLAKRPGDAAYGWARFDNIRIQILAPEADHDA